MNSRTFLACSIALSAFLIAASGAQAQFHMDTTPSAQRATAAKALGAGDAARALPPGPGIHPLSPLGGAQGTPLTAQPSAPVSTVQPYAGTAPASSAPPVGLNAASKPSDPSVDDPNKPRQPLKPKSLSSGITPR